MSFCCVAQSIHWGLSYVKNFGDFCHACLMLHVSDRIRLNFNQIFLILSTGLSGIYLLSWLLEPRGRGGGGYGGGLWGGGYHLTVLPHPLLIFSQSNNLIQDVDNYKFAYFMTNSANFWRSQLPDLDLHYLLRQGISGFSRPRVNYSSVSTLLFAFYQILLYFSLLSSTSSSVYFLPFSEIWHKMTHKGWCVINLYHSG